MSVHLITGIIFTGMLGMVELSLAAEPGQKIVLQGNTKGAMACISCHGADGAGQASAGFPRLAGLDKDYLVKQLNSFVKGSRSNPIMEPVARALNEQEMTAVATYYATRRTPNPNAGKGDKSLMAEDKRLALYGNWDKDIPACVACHGPGGQGVGSHFPALAGQHASYMEQQIHAWKSGARHNDPNQLMQGVAQRLSKEEVKAVAAYFASLPANVK